MGDLSRGHAHIRNACQDAIYATYDRLAPLQKIERYTVIMYDKLSPLSDINLTRMELFCKNGRAMDKLPPTQVNITCFFNIMFLSFT